ncbi:MAG: 8-oxo-dGTP diphosphatase [Candidatus Sumerlaeia bacterium]
MTFIPATLCYVRRSGQTLMMHRVKKRDDMHRGKWNGLGGKLEPGESPEQCVIREVREESGLLIRRPQLKGVLTFPRFDGQHDWLVFVFVAREFEGDIHPPDAAAEGRLEWIADDALAGLELWEGDRIFLPWLDEPGFFSGRFVYENGRLLSHEATFYR